MLAKIVILTFMAAILFCLGSAAVFLLKDQGGSQRLVKALSWRIGLSLFLFIMLLAGFFFGFIHPHMLT